MLDFFKSTGNVIDREHRTFFGNKRYADFLPSKVHGLEAFGRKEARVNLVRLYMYTKGYALDTILSDSLGKEKRKIGAEFYKAITAPDERETAYVYSEMLSKLSKENIPKFNSEDESNFLEKYSKFMYLVHTFVDAEQIVNREVSSAKSLAVQKKKLQERISANIIDEYAEAKKRIKSADIYGGTDNYEIITDKAYIEANQNREKEIKELVKKKEEEVSRYKKIYENYAKAKLSKRKMQEICEQEGNYKRELDEKIKKKKIKEEFLNRMYYLKKAMDESEKAINLVSLNTRIISYGFFDGLIFDKIWDFVQEINEFEEKMEDTLVKVKEQIEPIIADEWENEIITFSDMKEFNKKEKKLLERKNERHTLIEPLMKVTKIDRTMKKNNKSKEMTLNKN